MGLQRTGLIFFVALMAPIVASTQEQGPLNRQEILQWGAAEHQALQWLAVEAGQALPSGTGPFSVAELHMELQRIDVLRLSAVGRERYRWLQQRLSPADIRERAAVVQPDFAFSAGLDVNVELYLNSNNEVPYREYRERQRLPFLSIPLEAWAGNHGYGIIDIDLRKFPPAPGGVLTSEPDPWTNVVFTDVNSIDIEFPSRAFLAVGGDFWNLQFGRDDLRWGNGHTGSLYLGDSVREYDFARLSAFWRVFKYSTVWIGMDGNLTPAEEADLAAADSDPDFRSKYEDITDLHRSFLAHRFEVRAWDRVNFIATQGIMYGGRNMELRYLNPMMLYHNLYTNPLPGNAHMSFEIEATLRPGLVAYAHLAPDQWSSPLEDGDYTVNEPNAVAYMAGIRWLKPLDHGFVQTIGEAVFVDPWMYIHNRGHTSITYRRRIATEHFRDGGGRTWLEEPLGYYTGNDSAVIFLESRYVEPGRWFSGVRGRLEVRGERQITDTLPDRDEPNMLPEDNEAVTPTGDFPEWTTALTIFGEVQPGITRRNLTVGSELTWMTVTNLGNVDAAPEHDVQLVVYASMKF